MTKDKGQVRERLEGRKEDKSLLYHWGRECYTLWIAHAFILRETPLGGAGADEETEAHTGNATCLLSLS